MKNSLKIKNTHQQAHAPKSQFGVGDFYGTGIKAKIGQVRGSYFGPRTSDGKMGTPPKSLA